MNQSISLSAIILFLLNLPFSQQQLHTPFEILKMLQESKIEYEIRILEEKIPPPDYSDRLTSNYWYRQEKDGKIKLEVYQIKPETQGWLDKAEQEFRNHHDQQAREYYLKALDSQPEVAVIMTYIGQTYEPEGDFDQAMEWYKKALAANPADYMAHWFLADALVIKGEEERALEELTLAQIFNRNIPRMKKSREFIYKSCGLRVEDWVFNPQYKLEKTGENHVVISAAPAWLAYAMAKALWTYEPGYATSMGKPASSALYSGEEQEALAAEYGYLSSQPAEQFQDYPDLNVLKRAIEARKIGEYVIYEVLLPQYPRLAFELPPNIIESLKQYVLEIRAEKETPVQ
ncbi:MAG TPA: tetratricopeptide repeat protein [Candidatus Saccharicenans sp.]|jgi:tetratricopeptide (TPR) repeat protein|nr:tetratricopeptide repeat protein [Candidatus Saccharicenans sp.]HOL45805.1 tetratricopeptide repeat protein [Candidatus Saccharicenans sp.]HOM93961.1 tetratricopeptide repeat protein [Candidatus Saccharicenans sp.]HOT69232.1 tetratricopeptide repeat protein [Candidatus Saccharicenans sp.]HPC87628.1 tetratricopeptide repeat protein [Candidatus Saccharicenans sp.]